MKSLRNMLAALSAMAFFTACAHYEVQVNGFVDTSRNTSVKQGAGVAVIYDVKAGDPAQEKVVKAKIEQLLKAKGYVISPVQSADYYLFFWYGIGTGPVDPAKLPLEMPGRTAAPAPEASAGKGDAGEFRRWLQLKLIDGKRYNEAGDTRYVWVGEATSTGPNPDLKEVVDYLLLPVFDHFGENTGAMPVIKISDGDKRIAELMKVQNIQAQ